jgi:hypothetical protein
LKLSVTGSKVAGVSLGKVPGGTGDGAGVWAPANNPKSRKAANTGARNVIEHVVTNVLILGLLTDARKATTTRGRLLLFAGV